MHKARILTFFKVQLYSPEVASFPISRTFYRCIHTDAGSRELRDLTLTALCHTLFSALYVHLLI